MTIPERFLLPKEFNSDFCLACMIVLSPVQLIFQDLAILLLPLELSSSLFSAVGRILVSVFSICPLFSARWTTYSSWFSSGFINVVSFPGLSSLPRYSFSLWIFIKQLFHVRHWDRAFINPFWRSAEADTVDNLWTGTCLKAELTGWYLSVLSPFSSYHYFSMLSQCAIINCGFP